MSKIIIYGSHYGTSKSYAEELARRLNIAVLSYKDLKDVNEYDDIIYVGSLYAGGICGMAKTLKKWNIGDNSKLIIVSVGLADPTSQQNIHSIRNNMKMQLPEQLYDMARIYHLRGGIDYAKLSALHRLMMGLVYKKCKGIPEEQQDEETKAMMETYNQKVDFVNFDDLNQLISEQF